MRIKIECEIEVDENIWGSHADKEEHEWFKSILEDKEDTMLILWSNEVGDEIGQTSNFKYEIL
jgi:hypothetical protein